MPFVRISMAEGKPQPYQQAVSDGIHQALVTALAIPVNDRFQVLDIHPQSNLIYDAGYLDIQRDDDIIFIQITMRVGRTVAQKKALYHALKESLTVAPGVKAGNIFVTILEIPLANWSFGNGLAQYA